VDHLRTGLHFEPGNASDLVEKVRWFGAHPAEVALMRAQARKEYETKYTGEENYAQMIHIYESVLSPQRSHAAGRPTLAPVAGASIY
jgi:glycosyltransferase involved in cell wall biosynthesis